MPISNDQNLLREIEKILNAQSGDYLKNNSLLGFCGRLIAAKPESRPGFQKKLGRDLIRLYDKQPSGFNLREKIARLRLILLSKFLTWRAISLAASFTIIAAFALNEANNYLPPDGSEQKFPEIQGVSREQKFLLPANKNQDQNQRVLKQDQAFKLVEYTLFDGSKVIALENILL